MSHAANLWLFFLAVFAVVVLPGLDMAYVLASSLTGGRRSGLAAVAGIVAGGMCHVTAGAFGVAVVLRVMPGAFNVMLIAGGIYVAWIGWSLMRSGISLQDTAVTRRSWLETFRRGALTNLLNPKAYLFMLAVFPQFVRAEYGPIWIQAIEMWVIIMLTQITVYGAVALLADRLRNWIARSPATQVAIARTVGVLLIAIAVATGLEGWRFR